MRTWASIVITTLAVVTLLAACTPAAPTAAPTKPAAPAATTAAPVATKPVAPAGATSTAPAAPAATAAPTKPVSKVKRGGTIIYARSSILDDLDNVTSISFNTPTVSLVYEHLLNYEEVDRKTAKYELKPQLAESWDLTNPSKIVVKLKKGIKFADGSDFNAEAVKWQLDRARTHPKSQCKDKVDAIQSIDVVDPSTISINLIKPSAGQLIKLSNAVVATGAYCNGIPSKAHVDKNGPEAHSTNPIGTGPMVLADWQRGDKATFKKRDGYWKMGEDGQPLPYLDGFVDRYVRDSAVAFIELRGGTVQLSNQILASDVAIAKSNPDVQYEELSQGAQLRFVYSLNQYKGPFKDNVKLRQAAWYAIDLESMANTMTLNRGKATYYNYWVPGILGYDESIPKYKYDPAKAKQLVAEAGYPNGLDIDATTIAADPDRKIMEVAKFMWDAVGLRTRIDATERAAALATMRAGNATISHYSVTLLPDPDLFAPKALICDSMNNWANWCNKKFDDCIAEGGQSNDPAKRHGTYKRCLTIFQEDAFIGSGYLDPYPIVAYKTVRGLTTNWRDVDVRGAWLDK